MLLNRCVQVLPSLLAQVNNIGLQGRETLHVLTVSVSFLIVFEKGHAHSWALQLASARL